MEISDDEPQIFVFNETCAMCIQAGVGRLKKVYKTKDVAQRKVWRDGVRKILREGLKNGFTGNHTERIEQFREHTKSDVVLQNRKLTFGVAQKILNLFLKYCWSLGWISEPRDCPIDRRILGELTLRPDLPSDMRWSEMNRTQYEKVMEKVDEKIKGEKRKNLSRARWEFETWERLRNQEKP